MKRSDVSIRHSSTLVCLAILLFLPALWWWPLLTGYLPDFMDTVTFLYPLRVAVARQIREGSIPLWLPNNFCGVPLAANPQVAVWYPLNWPFYLCPRTTVYGVTCIAHYVLAGWGAFFLTKFHTRLNSTACLAGLTFQFGSMMISRMALLPHVNSAAWIPWIFLAAERAVRENHWLPKKQGALLAITLSLQLLSGSPQLSYYTIMALAILWCFRTVQSRPYREIPIKIIRLLLIGLLACAVCGIQLVPTAELLQHVRRGELAVEKLQSQALNGPYLWTALIGGTLDNCEDTDSINAVGLGIIFLALFALWRKRTRKQVSPYLFIALFSWLLAIGPAFPFWSKLIPGLTRFHAPRRSLILLSVMMPIAAGIGAGLLHGLLRAAPRRRLIYFATLGLALVSSVWILPRLERVFANPGRLFPTSQRIQALTGRRYITLDPTMNYAYDSRRSDYGTSLLPNAASLTGLFDAQGYDPLVPERLAMARDFACTRSGIFWPSHGALFTDPMSPILKLLAVQYVIGRYDLFDPGRILTGRSIDSQAISLQTEKLDADSKWPIHRFRENRPLAWSVAAVYHAANPKDALLKAIADDPYLIAWTESATNINGPLEQSKDVKIRTESGGSVELRFNASSERYQFMCVSQNWFPGWTAETESGLKIQTLPVNGTITGLVIPPGTSNVTLSYHPSSFLRGLLLTIAGLLICTALYIRKSQPLRHRRTES